MSAPRGRATALLLAPVALFLAVFFAYPLGRTLLVALDAPDAWAWLGAPYVRDRVATALLQAGLSVLLTLALAIPLAWLHHARRMPWSRWHLALHAAPFVLPVFVVVYGMQGVLGPRGLVAEATGLDVLSALRPLGAVVVAHAYYNYGFAARLLHATLERRPRRLEDAAQTLGAPPGDAFRRVSLPLLLPSLAAIALLVFLFSFSSFGVVLFLGAGQVSTLETLLYQNLGGGFPREDRAAVLGVVQLAFNLALFLAYALLLRRARGLERDPTPRRRPARAWHHAAAWAGLALAMLPPLMVLAGAFQVRGDWSLEAWRALLDAGHPDHLAGFSLGRAVAWSLAYAAGALALAVSLTALLAYGARRLGGRTRAVADALATLPLGTSSLLLGLGFVLAFGAGSALDLRGEPAAILLAHTLIAFPFAARVLLPAFDALDARLDEAAALLGASPRGVAWRVHLPLLAGPLAAAAGLAAAVSLGDFGASLLLMRPDTMALSVWIARHDAPFNPVLKAEAVALSALLMALAATLFLVVERLRGKEESW